MNKFGEIVEGVACGIEDWWAFAGDPLISGTVFMVSYGLVAWLILRNAARMLGRERQYWRLCGWLFVFQVANTHLDLHGLIYTTGRCLAHLQGWYDNRRDVQLLALIGLALVAVLAVLIVLDLFSRNIIGNVLLTAGIVIALGFTVMKGINFHGLEQYYGGAYGPFRGADLVELSGVAIAFVAAVFRALRRP